jgi:lipopolysaccharide biosynthesis glycosyltransferase
MEYSFVTFLGTDSFLPGVLALNNSLKNYNKSYGLLVLTTDLVSPASIAALESKNIRYKHVARIKNPNARGDDQRNFGHMYTKLRIFELEEFDKVVYIDADMLVCCNVEELFDCPHMSAVVAGALKPECSHWNELNAGFLVVVPDKALAERMYALVDSTPSDDGSDQGFLHSFYSNWANDKHLHLDHKYNVPVYDIDVYARLNYFKFSYRNGALDTNISIIHYWGYDKPWYHDGRLLNIRSQRSEDRAYMLWWDVYQPRQRKFRIFYYIAGKFVSLFKRK